MREFLLAVGAYVVALGAVLAMVDFDSAARWKYILAMTPLVPALWGAVAVGRHLGQVDEMQRQLQVEAMAAGFGAAMVAAITFGFLGMAGLDTSRWGPWAIYSIGMLTWAVRAGHLARPGR